MDWISENVSKAIWSFLSNFANDAVQDGIKRLTNFLISTFNDLNQYVNVDAFLVPFQIIAVALLGFNVLKMIINKAANGAFGDGDFTFTQLIVRIIYSAAMIYFLPWGLVHLALPFKNLLMKGISTIAMARFNLGTSADFLINLDDLMMAGGMVIISYLILGISFFILSISTVIMYFELVIAYLWAPFSAANSVNGSDAVKTWTSNTAAIILTQICYVLLLQIMLACLIVFKTDFVLRNLSCIAIIVLMLRGPSLLSKYLYSSGVGSGTVKSLTSVSRIMSMKKMLGK